MPPHNQRGNWYFANFQTCLDKYNVISQTETGTTVTVKAFRKQEMTHPTGLWCLLSTQKQKSNRKQRIYSMLINTFHFKKILLFFDVLALS